MGAPDIESDHAGEGERTPLLPGTRRNSRAAGRTKTAVQWVAQNAVAVILSSMMLVIITLCIFFGSGYSNLPATKKSHTCLTPACVHASSEILYNLSPDYKNIDACTNFEELVCGGWSERHDLRPDQGDAFTGTIMSENSQMLLRHILEAPYPGSSKHSSFSPARLLQSVSSVDEQNFNKLRDAYDACMDEKAIKLSGLRSLLDIIHQVRDMFPYPPPALQKETSSSIIEKDGLSDVIHYLASLGVPALVALGAGADDKDPDTVVVQVAPPYRIGLPAKDYYLDDKVVKKYEDTIAQIMKNLHPDDSVNKGYASDIVEFEKKLAEASPDAQDRDDVTQYYNPMSLKEANSLTPKIQLAAIIRSLAPADVEVDRIIVMSPSYMKNLTSILSDTPRETVQNYLIWKVIQAFALNTEADEFKPYFRFRNELAGKDPDSTPERWRTCVGHVDDGLGWILSRFFVEKAFSEEAKNLGDRIVSDIKEMFIQTLSSTSWMDKSVRELAIDKVHNIVQKIGYPTKSPNIMDPPSLKDFYGSVKVSKSTFFDNALSMSRFEVAREWSSLGKPVDRDAWGMSVPTVNAYYSPPGNEIVFPAGIMQFPVFDVAVPQYLSYGAFGSVSGHELSHAFDCTGRHYDQNGNFTDWWTPRTVKNFEDRAECFVHQYHEYTVPGPDGEPLHVNGKLTLGENIADAGGLTAAFAAWKKRRAETPNQDLPGLQHFTQEQLFFVSYANWWCGKSRNETAVNRIYTDPHAPKWARILGTMANSRDFKESFRCESKEPVCELW